MKYENEGKKSPRLKIKLPPGYLEKNRVRLMLMEDHEEINEVKTED